MPVPTVVAAGAMRHSEQPTLTTPTGLVLRPWTDADAATVLAAFSDPSVRQFNPWRDVHTLEQAGDWITQQRTLWANESTACWAITRDRIVLGRIAVRSILLADGTGEIGYWMLANARGQGAATEATTAAARWGLHDLGLHRLVLHHSVRNPASCRVAEKAGFRWEGTERDGKLHPDGWHDMHVHARLATD